MWDLLYYIIPQMIIFFQNISQNANVDEDFDKMIEASEIGKPDQEWYFQIFLYESQTILKKKN